MMMTGHLSLAGVRRHSPKGLGSFLMRIPRHARDAVARHERVVVVSHERPAFVIMHPYDAAADAPTARRGRPLREALGLLAGAAPPDPGFADDMEAVLADVGPAPADPRARP